MKLKPGQKLPVICEVIKSHEGYKMTACAKCGAVPVIGTKIKITALYENKHPYWQCPSCGYIKTTHDYRSGNCCYESCLSDPIDQEPEVLTENQELIRAALKNLQPAVDDDIPF